MKDLEQWVDTLPPDGSWWSANSRKVFIRVAGDLIDRGLSPEVVKDVLEDIYHAVKAEHGD